VIGQVLLWQCNSDNSMRRHVTDTTRRHFGRGVQVLALGHAQEDKDLDDLGPWPRGYLRLPHQ
jgi:hypothetical protein